MNDWAEKITMKADTKLLETWMMRLVGWGAGIFFHLLSGRSHVELEQVQWQVYRLMNNHTNIQHSYRLKQDIRIFNC